MCLHRDTSALGLGGVGVLEYSLDGNSFGNIYFIIGYRVPGD
jgi:hypothetical protein